MIHGKQIFYHLCHKVQPTHLVHSNLMISYQPPVMKKKLLMETLPIKAHLLAYCLESPPKKERFPIKKRQEDDSRKKQTYRQSSSEFRKWQQKQTSLISGKPVLNIF